MLDGDENNFIKSVLNVINPKVIILVILNANIDQFVGWDWLLAWWNGYRPRQGTSLANRWHKLSISLLIVTDSIFSLCFSWCPSLKGAAMEFTDFKNNEEPAGQPFLHMNFDDGFKWDPFFVNLKSFSFSDFFLVLNFLFANHFVAFFYCNPRWDTKDDANDQDNGFVCKRKIWPTRWTEHVKNYLWTVFMTNTNKNNTKLDITLYILVLWVLGLKWKWALSALSAFYGGDLRHHALTAQCRLNFVVSCYKEKEKSICKVCHK